MLGRSFIDGVAVKASSARIGRLLVSSKASCFLARPPDKEGWGEVILAFSGAPRSDVINVVLCRRV
ncbi:MAG: hypothetical protein IJY05_00595 [Clostridia bacterium]|nr:hypothetical protein [Clostridia bacterium]